jgi:3-oxocholest-4-en-26-oyl-CoA dehydrogenase alpha subunit
MQLEYTAEQEQLRAEIRATLAQVTTPDRSAAIRERIEGGPEVRECVRALAAANLLGVGWPKEFGGRRFSAIEQFIFAEEARRVNAPIPLVTLNTVGPTLMQFGTEQQKHTFLPAILDGTVQSAYRVAVISTFGGGANEIQRDIIAMAGLGMPRAPRDLRATDKSGGPTQ